MMLYYILAICCNEGLIEGENTRIYLLQIRREYSNMHSKDRERIRIFSPRTKNDLNSQEFLKEIEEYENTLAA